MDGIKCSYCSLTVLENINVHISQCVKLVVSKCSMPINLYLFKIFNKTVYYISVILSNHSLMYNVQTTSFEKNF
jgi:hypothetical protein